MDSLNLLIDLSQRSGVKIRHEDAARLSTLAGIVAHFRSARTEQTPDGRS